MTISRVTQDGLETLFANTPANSRNTQDGLETLFTVVPPDTRISQIGLEVLYRLPPVCGDGRRATICWIDSQFGNLSLYGAAPVSHFDEWIPDVMMIGPKATRLGNGDPEPWEFRSDYIAMFSLDGILAVDEWKMLRLREHLVHGGVCYVSTADKNNTVYTCKIAQDVDPPMINMSSRTILDFRMSFILRSASDPTAPLICVY